MWKIKAVIKQKTAKKELENKVDEAITSGKTFALSFTVFLAIVREGFEIVLFYSQIFFLNDF